MAARSQLLAAGISCGVITRLIRAGFLHPLHRGVYAVGHLALAQYGREQAALLACGEGAVISRRSALYLWGLRESPPGDVEVAVPGRHCRRRTGIRLYIVEALDPRDIRVRHGLPTTSPAKSLIDFAATAGWEELGHAVAEARVRKLIREGELEAGVERAGRVRGAAQMRAFLRDERGPAVTRSHAERRFRSALRQAGLPEPSTNVRIAGYEVDFAWKAEKVVLEVDGWQFHSHRRAFERDRKKAMVLSDAGYHTSRVTVRQFTDELLYLIAHVARTLDRRARSAH